MNKLYQNLVRTGLNDTESGNYIYYEDEIKKLMKWSQIDEIRLSYLLVRLRNDKRVAAVDYYYEYYYLVVDVVFYLDYIKGGK